MFTDFGWLGPKRTLVIRTLASSRIASVTQNRTLRNWLKRDGGGAGVFPGGPGDPGRTGGRGVGRDPGPGGLAPIRSFCARQSGLAEDDYRDLACRLPLVFEEGRHLLRLGTVEPVVLLPLGDSCRGVEPLAQHLQGHVRVGDQVVIPARMLGR